MSETLLANQIRYSGNSPLDAKLAPVASLTELYKIPFSQRWVSMTVFVESEQKEYWLVNGILNMNWKEKIAETPITGDDI